MPPKRKPDQATLGAVFRSEIEILPDVFFDLLKHYGVVRPQPDVRVVYPPSENVAEDVPRAPTNDAPVISMMQHMAVVRAIRGVIAANFITAPQKSKKELNQVALRLWDCILPSLVIIEESRNELAQRMISLLTNTKRHDQQKPLPSFEVIQGIKEVVKTMAFVIRPSSGMRYYLTPEVRQRLLNGFGQERSGGRRLLNEPEIFITLLDDLFEFYSQVGRGARTDRVVRLPHGSSPAIVSEIFTESAFDRGDDNEGLNIPSRLVGWFVAVIDRMEFDSYFLNDALNPSPPKGAPSSGFFECTQLLEKRDFPKDFGTYKEIIERRAKFVGAFRCETFDVTINEMEMLRQYLKTDCVRADDDDDGWFMPVPEIQPNSILQHHPNDPALPMSVSPMFSYLALRAMQMVIDETNDVSVFEEMESRKRVVLRQLTWGARVRVRPPRIPSTKRDEIQNALGLISQVQANRGPSGAFAQMVLVAQTVCFPPVFGLQFVNAEKNFTYNDNALFVVNEGTLKLMEIPFPGKKRRALAGMDVIKALFDFLCPKLPFWNAIGPQWNQLTLELANLVSPPTDRDVNSRPRDDCQNWFDWLGFVKKATITKPPSRPSSGFGWTPQGGDDRKRPRDDTAIELGVVKQPDFAVLPRVQITPNKDATRDARWGKDILMLSENKGFSRGKLYDRVPYSGKGKAGWAWELAEDQDDIPLYEKDGFVFEWDPNSGIWKPLLDEFGDPVRQEDDEDESEAQEQIEDANEEVQTAPSVVAESLIPSVFDENEENYFGYLRSQGRPFIESLRGAQRREGNGVVSAYFPGKGKGGVYLGRVGGEFDRKVFPTEDSDVDSENTDEDSTVFSDSKRTGNAERNEESDSDNDEEDDENSNVDDEESGESLPGGTVNDGASMRTSNNEYGTTTMGTSEFPDLEDADDESESTKQDAPLRMMRRTLMDF